MIKWEHSIFALPFALCGAMLAAGGMPGWRQLAWIVVAMVSVNLTQEVGNRVVGTRSTLPADVSNRAGAGFRQS